jgi:hypothetical protein
LSTWINAPSPRPYRDTAEQAALKLTVGNTNIGSAAAAAVSFTIAGLDAEDTGTVTFTDAGNNKVTVAVDGAHTSYTANLTSLTDGSISSSLAVNTDTAGNTFTPVAGNSATLDRDTAEQAALKLTVNNGSPIPIWAANAGTVPFTIAGLDPEDAGTVTFTDGTNQVAVSITGIQTGYTANLTVRQQ